MLCSGIALARFVLSLWWTRSSLGIMIRFRTGDVKDELPLTELSGKADSFVYTVNVSYSLLLVLLLFLVLF